MDLSLHNLIVKFLCVGFANMFFPMKPSQLKEHFSIKHPDHSNKDIAFFENLKSKIMKRNTLSNMFRKGNTMNKEGMLASYNISKLIVKDGNHIVLARRSFFLLFLRLSQLL